MTSATSVHEPIAPALEQDRYHVLDAIRGFAVLGILFMNINGMGENSASYDNPFWKGTPGASDLWIWGFMFVWVDGKFRAIFGMLFGASAILLNSRLEKKGVVSGDIYFRRNLWLLVVGILHAFCLWYGDVLYVYAMCAFLLYPFRHMAAKSLLIISMVLMTYSAGLYFFRSLYFQNNARIAKAAAVIEEQDGDLTADQSNAVDYVQSKRQEFFPTEQEISEDRAKYLGGFWGALKYRTMQAISNQANPYFSGYHVDALWPMFLGMALLKSGILTGDRRRRFYWKMGFLGYLLGVPLSLLIAWTLIQTGHPVEVKFSAPVSIGTDIGRVLVSLGHLGIFIALYKAGVAKKIMDALTAAGRMAMSNYIFQSIMGSFLFCGVGFGLYSKYSRAGLFAIALSISAFQLLASPIWFKHFNFGPLEYLWRALTYWRRPVFRRKNTLSIFEQEPVGN